MSYCGTCGGFYNESCTHWPMCKPAPNPHATPPQPVEPPAGAEQGCRCQSCGRLFCIDLYVPDEVWRQITPKSGEGGLLCGSCIMQRMESRAKEADAFGAYNLHSLIGTPSPTGRIAAMVARARSPQGE